MRHLVVYVRLRICTYAIASLCHIPVIIYVKQPWYVDTSLGVHISDSVNNYMLVYVLFYVINFPLFILCVYNR